MAPHTIEDLQNLPFTQAPPGYASDENALPTHRPPQNVQRPSEGWLRNPAWIGKLSP